MREYLYALYTFRKGEVTFGVISRRLPNLASWRYNAIIGVLRDNAAPKTSVQAINNKRSLCQGRSAADRTVSTEAGRVGSITTDRHSSGLMDIALAAGVL